MFAQNSVFARRWLTAGALGLSLALATFNASAGTLAVEIRVERSMRITDQSAERNVQRPGPVYAEQCPEKAPKRDTDRKRLKRLLA